MSFKKSESGKKLLISLELGHLSNEVVAGGDLLLERMSPYLSCIKITVVVPQIGIEHWKNRDAIITVLKTNLFDHSLFKVAIFFSYFIRAIQATRILYKTQFDILYSSTNIFPDIFSAFLFKITHPKIFWIARVHHLLPKPKQREGNILTNLFAYFVETIALKMSKNADLVIALNPILYEQLASLDFKKSKMAVVGGGVDFTVIQKIKARNPKYDGIFVGRLHRTKGILDLLEIWQKIKASLPNAKLAVVGEGKPEMLKQLKGEIKKRNLSQNVQLLGALPEIQVYQVLKNSKIFLFTDHEAGFGLAVAEAMAAGLPVVAYNLPIFGTVYKKGYVTVKIDDTKSFAKMFIKILKRPAQQKKLSMEAVDQAIKYDWANTAMKFENQVLIAIAQRPGPKKYFNGVKKSINPNL